MYLTAVLKTGVRIQEQLKFLTAVSSFGRRFALSEVIAKKHFPK